MCMDPAGEGAPNWDELYEVAAGQSGHFTTAQAAEARYSTQLLRKHALAGRVLRVQRGIYRLVHFPAGEHEDLVRLWLWSDRAGVISHQSALALHGLSDVLPKDAHLTLPAAWRRRRLRVPAGVSLHHSDVAPRDRSWVGPIPVTGVARTLADCAHSGLSPEHLLDAARGALWRGLVQRAELAGVEAALAPFGGLER